MKSIRPQFTGEEYVALKQEAGRLDVTAIRLVRDRALRIVTEDTLLCSTKMMCDEMAKYREVLNEIIKGEIFSDGL